MYQKGENQDSFKNASQGHLKGFGRFKDFLRQQPKVKGFPGLYRPCCMVTLVPYL